MPTQSKPQYSATKPKWLSKYYLIGYFVVFVAIVVAVYMYQNPKLDSQTLKGVDADNNGVRDDVQQYIISNNSDVRTQKALMQSAGVMQKFMLSYSSDRNTLLAIDKEKRLSNDCMEYILGASGGASLYSQVLAKTLDTRERKVAYNRALSTMGGQAYMLTAEKDLKKGCSFNPDI